MNRWTPAKRGFAAWRRKAAIRVRGASAHIVGPEATVRKLVMTATALGFLDAAAWDFKTIAGLAATGISVAILNECMD
ncbi:hypothetical protein [Catenulispora acidiphila]|uniref:hypothetical protein n=1 Tax=Catenulispora acidiphila TaxID=304895 RepID=UPI00019E37A2|nr:hypothetical protein [Catenulispora acidiphila]